MSEAERQKRIFISYARADEGFALNLARDLRDKGTGVWIDQLDIPVGAPWDVAVETALKECPVFAVVLSPRSTASQNVLDEVHFAISKAKKIVPIMIEACDLPMRLSRLQYIEFAGRDYKECLAACLAHIRTLFPDTQREAGDPGEGGADALAKFVHGQPGERLDGKRLLWADDNPRNNRYERSALEQLGAAVHLALDTAGAALIAAEIPFDLFISDMGRGADRRAGYTLLAKLREMKIEAPYIIYAGSNAEEHRREAIAAGALGCTNNPYELMDMIIASLSGPA